jgi:hypothetical protein
MIANSWTSFERNAAPAISSALAVKGGNGSRVAGPWRIDTFLILL